MKHVCLESMPQDICQPLAPTVISMNRQAIVKTLGADKETARSIRELVVDILWHTDENVDGIDSYTTEH